MDWKLFFISMPAVAWVAVFLLIVTVLVFIILTFFFVKNKNIKLKNFEIEEKVKTQKELYKTEGKNVLDNQSSTAHNLLKKIWIDLYEKGKSKFNIGDATELFLLEDIAHLIESKLNYEVKNDLTRNHITEKSDLDLQKYSEAKSLGYYRLVRDSLYSYNVQLPKYNLPDILKEISLDDYKRLFSEIYFGARKIAGGENNG